MTRGQVAYTEADATQSIFGLGIDESDVFGDEDIVTSAATNVLERLNVSVVSGESGGEDDTLVAVAGIEVGDSILSAVAVIIVADELVSEDVTEDASVTDENEVTFTDTQFDTGTQVIITWADLTRPDAGE